MGDMGYGGYGIWNMGKVMREGYGKDMGKAMGVAEGYGAVREKGVREGV